MQSEQDSGDEQAVDIKDLLPLEPAPQSSEEQKISLPDIRFSVFCAFLDKIAVLKLKPKLKYEQDCSTCRIIAQFFQHLLKNRDPYPIIRLLLPQVKGYIYLSSWTEKEEITA